MSIERPFAPPDDPNEVEHDTDFEMAGDAELDFDDDFARDLFNERDLEEEDDEFGDEW